jgi:GMP synthase (glutamine-hydrolysing)
VGERTRIINRMKSTLARLGIRDLKPRGSIFFGTRYHPEFTLAVAAGLIEMRAASLVAEGFGRDCAELVAVASDLRALHAEPERRDLA